MDSITRGEFHGIFNRVSKTINLKGCRSPDDIDKKLANAEHYYKKARSVVGKDTKEDRFIRKRLSRKAKHARQLIENGSPTFSQMIFIEAADNPHGIVNMTLHYGRKKAREIMLTTRKGKTLHGRGRYSRYSLLHRR